MRSVQLVGLAGRRCNGVERERELLLRLLRRRFGAEVGREIESRVAAAPVEQVETWAERVLSAATLAELFAD